MTLSARVTAMSVTICVLYLIVPPNLAVFAWDSWANVTTARSTVLVDVSLTVANGLAVLPLLSPPPIHVKRAWTWFAMPNYLNLILGDFRLAEKVPGSPLFVYLLALHCTAIVAHIWFLVTRYQQQQAEPAPPPPPEGMEMESVAVAE